MGKEKVEKRQLELGCLISKQACGGGAPGVELLYRSLALVVLRLQRAVKVRGFCLETAEQDAGFLEGRWMGHARASLDGGGR